MTFVQFCQYVAFGVQIITTLLTPVVMVYVILAARTFCGYRKVNQ